MEVIIGRSKLNIRRFTLIKGNRSLKEEYMFCRVENEIRILKLPAFFKKNKDVLNRKIMTWIVFSASRQIRKECLGCKERNRGISYVKDTPCYRCYLRYAGRERHRLFPDVEKKYYDNAHVKVWSALKKGTLKKPKRCQICHRKEASLAHHWDHEDPLNVTWLCNSCHGFLTHYYGESVRSLEPITKYIKENGRKL